MKTLVVRSAASLNEDDVDKAEVVLVIDDAVGALIAVISRLMDRSLDSRLLPHGISFGQWPILMHLWAEEGLNQRELSRRTFVEAGTTTRTLDRMAADGLIRRRRNPNDRRQQNVYLTEKGRRLRDTLVPAALATTAQATQALSDEELATLRVILGKMLGSLERDLNW